MIAYPNISAGLVPPSRAVVVERVRGLVREIVMIARERHSGERQPANCNIWTSNRGVKFDFVRGVRKRFVTEDAPIGMRGSARQ